MKETYTCPNIMSRFATFNGNPFINVPTIKWHLSNITTDFQGIKVIESFRGAFAILQPYFHPIRFESTSVAAEANITVFFRVNGAADLPQPFSSKTLAYAFSPVFNKSKVYFNDLHDWGEMHSNTKRNLKKVAVHEFLHSLGLRHSDSTQFPGDILNPIYTPNDDIIVSQDTIDGIEFLYADLKSTIPVGEDPPEKDPINLTDIFRDVLMDKKNLSRLRELSIVKIGELLDLDTDQDNKTKAENLKIVSDFLRLE